MHDTPVAPIKAPAALSPDGAAAGKSGTITDMARMKYPSARKVPAKLAAVTRRVSRAMPGSADNAVREEPTYPMPVLERTEDNIGTPMFRLTRDGSGNDTKPRT